MASDAPPGTETLDTAREIAQLRDLFQRRLLEDKAKNRLYDALHDQLELARDGLARQVLTPLLRELLLVADHLDSCLAGRATVQGVVDELREVLERRDVRVAPVGTAFDPEEHEVISTVEGESIRSGSVLKVVRPGYTWAGRTLRPARVVVGTTAPAGRSAGSAPLDADPS